MMVPLLYTVTIMPYRLAFVDFRIPLTGEMHSEPGEEFFWDVVARYTVDAAFIIDLLLSFFIGHYDIYGKAVTDVRQTAKHYLQTLFFLDLVACLPPEFFRSSSAPPPTGRMPISSHDYLAW